MKIKRKDLYRIWSSTTFYIFVVLFVQIIESFFPFSVTKVFMLLLLISTAIGIAKKTISVDGFFLSALILFGVYLFVYIVHEREVFSYVYPGVTVILYGCLLYTNASKVTTNINRKLLDRLILGYLIINLILYISKKQTYFQIEQYKGALPHTNMLGAVLFSLFIIEFWNKDIVAVINKVLITLIMLFTQSRTYLLMLGALWLLIITSVIWKKVHFVFKMLIVMIFLAMFGGVIFDRLITVVPGLSRFSSFRFTGNGRQILQEAYGQAILNSRVIDMIKGYPITRDYMSKISVEFYHSFTENSYVGFFLLFGIVGFGFLVTLLIRMLNSRTNIQNFIIMIIALITLWVQDTLLSIQTGILLLYSLNVANSNLGKSKTNYKIPFFYQTNREKRL